ASAEYTNLFTGLNNDQIVNTVYMNLFGRAAEPAGLQYWSLQLAQGKITVANLALTLANAAQGTDLVAVQSKVAAANAFTTYLETAATSAPELGYST
ncbi:DUF4214 domain-containing protein, partial [Enterococcus faecium]|uniref:DUF4214 domain-containing protein n=1 Tax=Enterococcus faecium TaxID=1352 RepID=UPI0034E95DB8